MGALSVVLYGGPYLLANETEKKLPLETISIQSIKLKAIRTVYDYKLNRHKNQLLGESDKNHNKKEKKIK